MKVNKLRNGFYQINIGMSMYDIRLLGKKWQLTFRTATQKEPTLIHWFPAKWVAVNYVEMLIREKAEVTPWPHPTTRPRLKP